MSYSRGGLLAAALLLSGVPGLRAQTLMLELDGPLQGSAFGSRLAVTGDLTGDGRPDFVVGAPFDGVSAPVSASDDGNSGSARAYAGVTGEELFALAGVEPSELLGWSVAAAGDVNGDGVADVAVGAPNADDWRGRVIVLSGDGGAPLLQVWGAQAGERFGWAIASVGDVNEDGRADLAVGAFQHDGALPAQGAVRIVSGFNGATLDELMGSHAFDHFGAAVAAPGDTDLDGVPDLLVTSALYDTDQVDVGGVSLRSGATGAQLFLVTGQNIADAFGAALAATGDLDGDGVPDALIGVPGSDVSGLNAGRALLVSGANGATILSFAPTIYYQSFGAALCAAGDLDEDGVLDLAISATGSIDPFTPKGGRVSIFKGAGGTLLQSIDSSNPAGSFGAGLAAADLDADGAGDLIVGAPYEGGTPLGPGVVSVYSGDVWLPLGAGTPGSSGTPDFLVEGEPVAGEPVTFLVEGAPPGAAAVLVVGASALMAPFKGGTLVPNPDWFSPVLTATGGGLLALAGPWPSGAPSGTDFHFQWWMSDPGAPQGWASTEGLHVVQP